MKTTASMHRNQLKTMIVKDIPDRFWGRVRKVRNYSSKCVEFP